MSRLAHYREVEQEIARHQSRLQELKNHPGLQKEMEFENKLHALLAEYGKDLGEAASILDPYSQARQAASARQPRTRRPRTVKIYRNPLTGETVESKGGNNKLLGGWKAQFGQEEVESWVLT